MARSGSTISTSPNMIPAATPSTSPSARGTWRNSVKLDDAIRHALDGNAVLFVGAGYSTLATNRMGKHLPTGAQLARTFLDDIGIDDALDLTLASELYIEAKGVTALISML